MIFKNGKFDLLKKLQDNLLEYALAQVDAWVRFLQDKRRRGNVLSRVVKPFFERKDVRAILGILLSLMVAFSGIWRGSEGYFGEGGEIPPLVRAESGFKLDEPEDKVVVKAESGVRVPMDEFVVSRGFYWWHQGIDMAAEIGTKVYAFRPGKVVQVNYWSQSYGNHVILDHEDGYMSLYGHLREGGIKVGVGDKVTAETVLGEIGSTGYSTGPHLHFEILKDGELINPGEVVGL